MALQAFKLGKVREGPYAARTFEEVGPGLRRRSTQRRDHAYASYKDLVALVVILLFHFLINCQNIFVNKIKLLFI